MPRTGVGSSAGRRRSAAGSVRLTGLRDLGRRDREESGHGNALRRWHSGRGEQIRAARRLETSGGPHGRNACGRAPGNGLAFLDASMAPPKRPASFGEPAQGRGEAGGDVREFVAPTAIRWPAGSAIGRGSATSASLRPRPRCSRSEWAPMSASATSTVGARENWPWRAGEAGAVPPRRTDLPDDVKALVADAVPGSTWAFLDAVGMRHAGEAAELAERLDDVPPRSSSRSSIDVLKQLIDVADLLASGTPAQELVRITNSTRTWPEAGRAGSDLTLPNWTPRWSGRAGDGCRHEGQAGGSDVRRRASVSLWIAERVRRPNQR